MLTELDKRIKSIDDQINNINKLAVDEQIDISELIKTLEERKHLIVSSLNAWDKVQIARNIERPTASDYIKYLIDDFCEFSGDRLYGDDPAVIAGFGFLNQQSIAVIAQEKGQNTRDKLKRNFGMPSPEGYRKSKRIMSLAAKFSVPLLTIIDTPGAYPGLGAEERGQGRAIADNLFYMSQLPVPVVVCVIGEGGSGGALALSIGDRILMLENSVYSVISPEGCASILYKDATLAPVAAESLKLTATDLLSFNVIDSIIPEPAGGAHYDSNKILADTKSAVISTFESLKTFDISDLLVQRYEKFRNLGKFYDDSVKLDELEG